MTPLVSKCRLKWILLLCHFLDFVKTRFAANIGVDIHRRESWSNIFIDCRSYLAAVFLVQFLEVFHEEFLIGLHEFLQELSVGFRFVWCTLYSASCLR